MTGFDVAYIFAGLLLVLTELVAIYQASKRNSGESQTLSHKVIAWIAVRPKRRRVFLLVGLIWLGYHWAFQ